MSTKGRKASARPRSRGRGRLGTGAKAILIALAGVAALGVIFFVSNGGREGAGAALAGRYPFVVGDPGPGELAPPMSLPVAGGGTFDLEALRGETVLLYFQEGAMCQPCWDQLRDIERQWDRFEEMGIDRIVSISTDPLGVLERKGAIEDLSTPLLSDSDVRVSSAYTTNQYGMMGRGYNGHSFIVVGRDGVILWRADYGGPPQYTMYLPVPDLLSDMRRGLEGDRTDD